MKKFIYAILVLFSLVSCDNLQTVIEIDLPEHEPKLVVNSSNKVGEKWKVYVSVSKGPLTSGDFNFLNDASVILLNSEQIVDSLFYNPSENRYESNILVQQGSNFTLQVSHPSYETISASLSPFDKIFIKSVSNLQLVSESANLRFEIDDPLSNNYYMINLKGFYKNSEDSLINEDFSENEKIYFYSDDPSLNQRQFSKNKLLFDDRLFDGTSKEFSLVINDYFLESLDSLQLNLWSVDYAFYQYYTTKIIQSNSGNNPIFSSEPVNVYNSFLDENGEIKGYGIFASSSKDSVIVHME